MVNILLFGILKLLHVVFAISWVGGVLFLNAVAVPSILGVPPNMRGTVMAQMAPRATKFFIIVGSLTLVFGFLTIIGLEALDVHRLTGTLWGLLILIGAALAVGMFLEGVYVVKPTIEKVIETGKKIAGAGGPPTPDLVKEMGGLQKKLVIASLTSLVLGFATVVLMVTANTLGG